MEFQPCQGKTSCRHDGKRCLTCGRSHEEIEWLRDLTDKMASIAIAYEYENVDVFTDYVARKIPKIVAHRLESADQIARTIREAVHAD